MIFPWLQYRKQCTHMPCQFSDEEMVEGSDMENKTAVETAVEIVMETAVETVVETVVETAVHTRQDSIDEIPTTLSPRCV